MGVGCEHRWRVQHLACRVKARDEASPAQRCPARSTNDNALWFVLPDLDNLTICTET